MKPVNTKLRSVNTGFWHDEYILDLNITEKALFLYFLTNSETTLAGVYKIALKKIALDTGLKIKDIENILSKFQKDKKINYTKGYIIIKNFLKHQSLNQSMIVNIEKTIEQLPEEIRDEYLKFVNPHKIINDRQTGDRLRQTGNRLRQTGNSVRQIESESEIEKEIEKEGERERERENEIKEPTETEVKEYFKSRGYSELEAENFYSYYKSQNWKTKAGISIKDNWKHKVKGFVNNSFSKQTNQEKIQKPSSIYKKCEVCGKTTSMEIDGIFACSYEHFLEAKKKGKTLQLKPPEVEQTFKTTEDKYSEQLKRPYS